MKLLATIYCFEIAKDQSLKYLVFQHGFSRPSPENPRSRKDYEGYFAEIERKEGPETDKVFLRVSNKGDLSAEGYVDLIVDLQLAGLISAELADAIV